MVHFSHLRLNGFKSFADRAEVDIGPGLNGIVGPNGCGKSNLVEALRWVMGESSAKRMRGSGMEDVIFAGTSKRPARNRAEVTLVLENPNHDAPAPFQNLDKIEVTRSIERDNGSVYRVNGRAVRARDVQMLFADTVAGANSPALVSQGRVTAMINAKPTDRRQVLEESAGVSGLYARRHEAELRLRAAENNLIRLDDIMGAQETQLNSLKKQARQARRYKNISNDLEEIEVLYYHLRWTELQQALKSQIQAFDEIEAAVAQAMKEITSLGTKEATLSAKVTDLRGQDTKLAAQIQSFQIEKQRVEDTLTRIEADKQRAEHDIKQAQDDRAFELEQMEAIENSRAIRESELSQLKNTKGHEQAIIDAERQEKEQRQLCEKLERALDQERQSFAQDCSERQSAEREIERLQESVKAKEDLLERLQSQKQTLDADNPDIEKLVSLQKKIAKDEEALEAEKQIVSNLRTQITDIRQEAEALQAQLYEDKALNDKLNNEINILEDLLNSSVENSGKAALDQIKPKKGYETALAKAMGDTLLAALEDRDANQYWIKLTPEKLPELSAQFESLSSHVKAPEALSICLSQIGIVAEDVAAEEIISALNPGQMAVSKDGAVYRWDGYVITQRSQSATALHLERKNRLEALRAEQKVIQDKVDALSKALDKERENQSVEDQKLKENEARINELEKLIASNRQESTRLAQKTQKLKDDRLRLETQITSARQEYEELENALKVAKQEFESRFDSNDEAGFERRQQKIEDKQSELAAQRSALDSLVREADRLRFEDKNRLNRIEQLERERQEAENKQAGSGKRLETLDQRIIKATQDLTALKTKPEELEDKKQTLLSQLSELESQRSDVSDELSESDQALRELQSHSRKIETQLSEEKEKRGGIKAHIETLRTQIEELQTDIENKLDCRPQELLSRIDWPEGQAFPALSEVRGKKEKLIRDRDQIGPVNLMAAEELEKAESEFETMVKERDDLIEAIAQLRGGIQKLNREARSRMSAAFEQVNMHYKRLFEQLFKGGKAYLELTESDDILEAGLEIFAQPPGKTLQHLGLLSGGEQTLASIALIFAMFLTNPAPICVLDEIDAPLDDSNVDKVCSLLEELATTSQTRFLVITHHRMTMARMHRLYGVTMAERGISQLVSVDLQQSFLAEAAE